MAQSNARPSGPQAEDPMIPGGRDPANLTHREPGAIGGQFSGGDTPEPERGWLGDATARDRALEGGGEPRERPRASTHRPERASAD